MRRVRTFIKHRGDVHELHAGEVLVAGRSDRCGIVLDDELASREHCRFELRGDDVYVVDLESRNGVLVNGLEVEGSEAVHHGDVVTVGRSQLTVSRQAREPRRTESGASVRRETSPGEYTASGNVVDLLRGATRRSLEDGEDIEAERSGRHLFSSLRGRLARGSDIARSTIDDTIDLGLALAERLRDPGWLDQVLELLVSADLVADAATRDRIVALAADVGPPRRALHAYLELTQKHGADPGSLGGL